MRFRVRFPVGSFEIFKWPILSVRIHSSWGSLSLKQKWVSRNFFEGKERPACKTDICVVLVVPNVKVWKPNFMTCHRTALPLQYLTPNQAYDYTIRNQDVPRYYYGNHYLSINIPTCTYNLYMGSNSMLIVDWVWNVMARAQKPDFFFRRNGRVHLTPYPPNVEYMVSS